jgi:hypothetical protein
MTLLMSMSKRIDETKMVKGMAACLTKSRT